jgi:hypothetical protein
MLRAETFGKKRWLITLSISLAKPRYEYEATVQANKLFIMEEYIIYLVKMC